MDCPKCSTPSDGGKVCANCGYQFTQEDQAAAATATATPTATINVGQVGGSVATLPAAAVAAPSTATRGAGSSYPVRVEIDAPEQNSRFFAIPVLGLIAREVMLIPHFIALYACFIAYAVLNLFLWIPALFTGKLPEVAYSFGGGTIRWATRVAAFYGGLTDRYPPFGFADDASYPVRVSIDVPAQNSRFFAIPALGYAARYIMLIPLAVLTVLFLYGWMICMVFLWIPVLINGKLPGFAYTLGGGAIRGYTRMGAWMFGLTDRYPPFDLSS